MSDGNGIDRAAGAIAERIGIRPELGIILGSGMGGLERDVQAAVHMPYTEIPGFPPIGVKGHDGVLTAGQLCGLPSAVMRGRYHHYEGHDAATIALPIRTLVRLGIRTLIVTNAAGGIHRTFRAGDLMLIDDHINLMWSNPLIGAVQQGETRFPDMSAPYDSRLQSIAEDVAREERIPLKRGVYVGLLGPSYETPAEVRMLRHLGGDAVGMSTVPEVLVARAAGAAVLGLSLIANTASGLTPDPLDHEDVMRAATQAGPVLRRLLLGVLRKLAEGG